jgi:hypothetical protein
MRKEYIKYSAKLLMDLFYQEYPHLDRHKADIRCVVNIIHFLINEYSDESYEKILVDDLEELVDALEEDGTLD